MVSFHRSKHSVAIDLNKGILLIRGFSLQPNVVDPLENDVISSIHQYLRYHFDLVSLVLNPDGLELYCGLFKQDIDLSDTSSLLEYFSDHLQTIIPTSLSLHPLAGYHLPFPNYSKNLPDDHKSLTSHYFMFHDLTIHNHHAKIMKILLEVENLTILFAQSRINGTSTHLTVKLDVSPHQDFGERKSQLVSNLKNSPYIEGNLSEVSPSYIKAHPGQVSLGFTSQPVEEEIFDSLLSLIPPILPSPDPVHVPPVRPLVARKRPERLESPISPAPDTLSDSLSPVPELDPDLEMLFQAYNWEVTRSELHHNPTYLENEFKSCQFHILVVSHLQDLNVAQEEILEDTDTPVFLLLDQMANLDRVHKSWNILSYHSLKELISLSL